MSLVSLGPTGRVRVRWSRWLLRVAALSLLIPLQLGIVRARLPSAMLEWYVPARLGGGLGLAIGLAALAVWMVRLDLRGRPGTIRVTSQGLEMSWRGRTTLIPTRRIANAWAAPETGHVHAELVGGDFVFGHAGDAYAADAVVQALGFGPSSRAITIPSSRPGTEVYINVAMGVLGPMLALVAGSMISGVLGVLEQYALVLPAASLVTIALLTRWAAEPRMRIGVDGIMARGAFGSSFVALDAASSVSRRGDAVTVTTQGRTLTGHFVDDSLADAVAHRIALVLELRRRAPEDPIGLAKLERHGRTVAEWRTRIADVCAGDVYRATHVTPEDLELVLASAAATVEHRVAAALALRAIDPERVEEGLRVAALASARPRVRVVLSRLAEDRASDAALEEVLEEPPLPKRLWGWGAER